MLRGYRLLIVAVGLVLTGAGPPKPSTDSNQTKSKADQSTRAPAIFATPKPIVIIQPTKQSGPCGPDWYQSDEDLCAQWKAADAARDAADYSNWTFWLSLVGTAGLLVTLYYTRIAVLVAKAATADADDAIAIAERNALSAENQVAVAKDAADRQLRPYLIFHQAVHGLPPQTDERGEWFDFVETISNQGYSPAVIVEVAIGISFDPTILPEQFPWQVRSQEAGTIVGRQNNLNPFASATIDELLVHPSAVVACRITYRSLWATTGEVFVAQDGKRLKYIQLPEERGGGIHYQGHDDAPEFRIMT